MRVRALSAVVLACSLLAAGCTAQEAISERSPSPTPQHTWSATKPKQISVGEFKIALAQLNRTVDEFKGNLEVFPKDVRPLLIASNGSSLAIEPDITRASKNSPYKFDLQSSYSGQDWMFFDSYDIKSSTGVFSYSIDTVNRNDLAQLGGVIEYSSDFYSDKEAVGFCNVMSGNRVKIRFNGTQSSIVDVTKSVPEEASSLIMDSCIVYFGLLQGIPLG